MNRDYVSMGKSVNLFFQTVTKINSLTRSTSQTMII